MAIITTAPIHHIYITITCLQLLHFCGLQGFGIPCNLPVEWIMIWCPSSLYRLCFIAWYFPTINELFSFSQEVFIPQVFLSPLASAWQPSHLRQTIQVSISYLQSSWYLLQMTNQESIMLERRKGLLFPCKRNKLGYKPTWRQTCRNLNTAQFIRSRRWRAG